MGVFSWFGSRRSADKPARLRRWVIPTVPDDPKLDEIKKAAAADVVEVEEDSKYFSPDGPGTRRMIFDRISTEREPMPVAMGSDSVSRSKIGFGR